MSMSKQDFQGLASVLADHRKRTEQLVGDSQEALLRKLETEIADVCMKRNSGFNQEKFFAVIRGSGK